VRSFREDVHIHAAAPLVFARLAALDRAREWLPPAFHAVDSAPGGLSFGLAMPGRVEAADLRVETEQAPELLELAARDGARASIVRLSWAVPAEGHRECHLTVEAQYHPVGGLFGPLLDLTLHRPHRRQAFRDALWRLKLLIEQRD